MDDDKHAFPRRRQSRKMAGVVVSIDGQRKTECGPAVCQIPNRFARQVRAFQRRVS